jgi:hypothetical protein
MTRPDGDEPIRRALLDIVQSVRGLAARARGICDLGSLDGRPMDPLTQRARQLSDQLEAAGDTMSMYEDREPSFKIERNHTDRGDEKIVIRCVTSVMSEVGRLDDPTADAIETRERVDLRGSSWSVGVPDLLSFFETLSKSGTLTVSTFDETFTVVLEDGKVVHAFSNESPVGLRLGDILVQQGATTPEKLRHFFDSHADEAGCMGEAAVVQGVVTRDQLRQALEFQVQQLFNRLFDAKDATFTFHDGTNHSPRVSVKMNLTRLLLESSFGSEERSMRITHG